MSLDARIQLSVVANLSRRPAATESGPFVAGFDPGTANPGINYATPRPGTPITAADVTALVATFRAAERLPRLEYVVSTAPALLDLLLAAGFTVEARHEYLVCTPDSLAVPPTPSGFRLHEPTTDDERLSLAAAQAEAFGADPTKVVPGDAARFRRLQESGGIALTAVSQAGDTVAAGQAVPPHDGVSEVAGIAVRPPYRRRGIAAALTAGLTTRLFATDADVAWLEAETPAAGRIYERIGYAPTGRRLYVSLPDQNNH